MKVAKRFYKKFIIIAMVTAMSGCVIQPADADFQSREEVNHLKQQEARHHRDRHAHHDMLSTSSASADFHAQQQVIKGRLSAVKFVGNDYIDGKDVPLSVKIGEGFTKATIQDQPATITRKQKDFYEVKGSGYIVSVAMDDNGVSSASWNENKRGSRKHGGLNIIK